MRSVLIRSSFANVIQSIVTGILLFVLYRFISLNYGINELGVWSLLLTIVSISKIFEIGISSSVTKFTALYLSQNKKNDAVILIESCLITNVIFNSFILAFVFYFSNKILIYIINDHIYLSLAINIIPYILLNGWINSISSIILAGLDGLQLMSKRATLVISAQLIMVVLSIISMPTYGLMGMALSQIFQSVIIIVIGWLILKKEFIGLNIFPKRWKYESIREVQGYAANIQLSSIFVIVSEPISKLFMGAYGGLESVGYFELISQIINRVRAIIVSANQAITPAIVGHYNSNLEKLKNIYILNVRLLIFVVISVNGIIIVLSSEISNIIFKYNNIEFISMLNILIIGWIVNSLTIAAYFFNMGSGSERLNLLSHIITGALNVSLGLLLGNYYKSTGVVLAYSFSLIIGGLFLLIKSNKIYKINLIDLLTKKELYSYFSLIVLVIFYIAINILMYNNIIMSVIGICLILLILIMSPIKSIFFAKNNFFQAN